MSSFPSYMFPECVADVSSGNPKVPTSTYRTEGKYAVVDQGKELVAGYVDDEESQFKGALPAIIFGDHTRAIKFVDFPFCLGADGVKVLQPKRGDLDPKYLYHYLRFIDLPSAGYSRHFKFLKEARIAIPDLGEQRRIVQVLDQVESLRAKRRAAIALLDELAQSIFLDMFGKVVSNDKGWPVGAVSDIVAKFESGKSIAEAESDGPDIKYRILRVSAVTTGRFNPSESKPAPAAYSPPDSHIVRDSDLIFSRANTEALIGAAAFAAAPPTNLLLPDKLWRFVWHDESSTHPLYVRQLFLQEEFRRQVRIRASGTSGSMKNISQANVLAIPCGVPPGSLQIEYGRKVELLDRLRVQHESHLADLDALFASLQDRAFNGTLWAEESTPVA